MEENFDCSFIPSTGKNTYQVDRRVGLMPGYDQAVI